MESPAL
jgi:hypothetical protein